MACTANRTGLILMVAVIAGGPAGAAAQDGSIVAWGWNDYGQSDLPEPNAGFVAVAAGDGHSLGLRSDGTIEAWGANHFGQCDVLEPGTAFVQATRGGHHGLGLLNDGSLRAWRWGALALVCVVVTLPRVVPWYVSRPEENHKGTTLKLLSANVMTANRDHESLLALVRDEQPDVVIVQEVNGRWIRALEGLRETFPHTVLQPERNNFGIALYSRYPITSSTVHRIGKFDLATLECVLDVEGQPVRIIATHPPPPIRPHVARERDAQLEVVGDLIHEHEGPPVLVLGDLNCTPWSVPYLDLVGSTGLENASRGFGLLPSWPTRLPGACRIPIDHCLHSSEFAVRDCRLGPAIGSDHLPLIVNVAFPVSSR